MVILAIDDERYALYLLKAAIQEAAPEAELFAAQTVEEGLLFARLNKVDVAFLDINLGAGNGLALAEGLKDIHADINLIFVTGYEEYMPQAIRMHASGYVNKPVSAEDIRYELDNLLNPISGRRKGIYVHTFGNFDIYVDGRLVPFTLSKAKEMLAYLVNREGASVTRQELAAVLFEDQPYTKKVQDYMSKIYTSLKKSLDEAGAGEILVKGRNLYAVDVSKFDSDFRRMFAGDEKAKSEFKGEYMLQYSWAELMLGEIKRFLDIF